MSKISIVVPIYNTAPYLKQCFDSLLAVDFDKELILINDGSSDNSLDIIKSYLKKYPKEIILIDKNNEGQGEARNNGIKQASGEYISFIDSDDFVDTKKYETFINLSFKSNADICFADGRLYGEKLHNKLLSRKFYFKNKNNKKILTGLKYLEDSVKLHSVRPEAWLGIYKKNFLIYNNLFFKAKIIYEDNLFFFSTLCLAKKVIYFKHDFYFYRKREGSIMSKKVSLHSLQSLCSISKCERQTIQNNNLKSRYLNSMPLSELWAMYKSKRAINKKEFFEVLKLLHFNLKGYKRIIILLFKLKKLEDIDYMDKND